MVVASYVFGCSFVWDWHKNEKKKQWDNADDIQRAELMRKKLERESKSKKIRDTMVKVGIAIIVVLGILAIVL